MRRPNLARAPFQDVRPVWLGATLLALLAVVLTTVSLTELLRASGQESTLLARLETLRARHDALRRELEASNRRLSSVKWARLSTEVGSLEEVVSQRGLSWTALLADLERLLPWDVRLTSIDPTWVDDEITVALNGVATSREAWLKLLARAFTDPSFSDPVPGMERAPGAENADGYRFQVRVRYWPGGKP